MPFAHIQYRWIRSSNYPYAKRRCCFIAICLIYSLIFAILGAVFLGLYIHKENELNSLNCSACAYLGANISCGYQLCCNNQGFSFTYSYCAGIYGEGLYFILFIVFFCYAAYELILMVCTLCNGSGLQNNGDVIIIDQNPQIIGLNNYQQGYQSNQTNQGYYKY
jgi:hypothetical protein